MPTDRLAHRHRRELGRGAGRDDGRGTGARRPSPARSAPLKVTEQTTRCDPLPHNPLKNYSPPPSLQRRQPAGLVAVGDPIGISAPIPSPPTPGSAQRGGVPSQHRQFLEPWDVHQGRQGPVFGSMLALWAAITAWRRPRRAGRGASHHHAVVASILTPTPPTTC